MNIKLFTATFILFGMQALVGLPVVSQPVSSTEDWERREILVQETSLTNISDTLEKGRWSNDGFTGPIKYLLSSEDDETNKLYVQWLSDEDGTVAYTVSIREFNIASEFKLELPECLSDDCTLSKIKAVHAYEEVEQTFLLNLVGLGRYSVGIFKQ